MKFVGRMSSATLKKLGHDPSKVCSTCTKKLTKKQRFGKYKQHKPCAKASKALEHLALKKPKAVTNKNKNDFILKLMYNEKPRNTNKTNK